MTLIIIDPYMYTTEKSFIVLRPTARYFSKQLTCTNSLQIIQLERYIFVILATYSEHLDNKKVQIIDQLISPITQGKKKLILL